ncbi:MAG: hypothetical protein J4F35_15715 [Candidatus Latescibacteria bacterium]|nr:hypothetical protein [Candidatus Latescibacterota bacterium]
MLPTTFGALLLSGNAALGESAKDIGGPKRVTGATFLSAVVVGRVATFPANGITPTDGST